MGLDYSQKQLLGIASQKPAGKHATLSHMSRRKSFKDNLQVYAFWTGLASTLVSVIQVFIIATKQ
jgi:hypothetical protein